MKLFFVLMLLSAGAFAEGNDKEKMFNEAKTMISANIEQKINALQALKTCISGATSKDQLKACGETHRDTMQGLKDENRSERRAFKDKKRSLKEEKKKE